MRDELIHSERQATGAVPIVLLLSIMGLAAENDAARVLSAQARLARDGLRNYRCSVEYTDYRDYAARKKEWEEASQRADIPAKIITRYKEDLEGSGRKYELQTVIADSNGRIKVAHTYGEYDLQGGRSATLRLDCAWDGAMNINHSRGARPDSTGGAVITPSRAMHFLFVRHPMNSFRDLFFTALDKAIETGRRVDVQAAEDGLQHVRFTCEDPLMSGGPKWTCTGTVDPSKDFAIPQWEFTLPNGNKSRFSATFTEISDGVWFPTEGRIEGFFAAGMPQAQTSVKITNVIVNDPNMDADVFHIPLPEGTHVTNRIAGIAYVVGDPSSTRALGDPTNTDHVVNDAVRKDDPAKRLILLPHIQKAIEQGNSFVLDIKTRTLVGVDKASNSAETLDSLRNGGMGDIFWDGGIVVVGETRIEPASAAPQPLLAFTEMNGGGRYKLPQDVKLPCSLRITDRRGSRHDVVVTQIREDGISITCRPVSNR